MTTKQGTTQVFRQLLKVIEAAGLRDVFPRTRLMTLTIQHPVRETLEIRVQGGNGPAERIIEMQFTVPSYERQPRETQDVLRMDGTGHPLEVYTPGSVVASTRPTDFKHCMQYYKDKLEQEEYTQAAMRGYSLRVQFYDTIPQEHEV